MPNPLVILLVDDDRDCRFLAEWTLKKTFNDCSVVSCSSFDEALARLGEVRPDAIVTDNQLGVRSGCDLIEYVRANNIACPVVMVTCSEDPQVMDKAYRVGVTKVFRSGDDEFAVFLKAQLDELPR